MYLRTDFDEFFGEVGRASRINRLDFGGDPDDDFTLYPDRDTDPEIFYCPARVISFFLQ